MDNKKFEQLIDLIINENEEQARALFHDIVVEKSREIYEGMMDDEMQEGMGGQVGDLLDEINAEEAGGMTEDDEADIEFDDGEEDGEEVELELDDEGMQGGEEGLEDRVVDLEDKLDSLMAEFEEIMGGGDDDMGDDDMGDDDMGDDDMGDDDMGAGGEEAMMEAVQLKQVGGSTYNKYGQMGDNGAQTKSPSLQNSGQAGMDSKPVRFSGQAESVPNSPKAPSNAYTKGETSVKNANNFKNSPGKGNFSEKGESTPKPVTKDEAGTVRSPVAESRKMTNRRVK